MHIAGIVQTLLDDDLEAREQAGAADTEAGVRASDAAAIVSQGVDG
jgi:hypothetical protein